MATTLHSNLKIRDEYFKTAAMEGVAQAVDGISEGTRGGIVLDSEMLKGFYKYDDYFAFSDIVSRRDLTSVSAATAIAPAEDEEVSVKLFRKIGPIDMTLGGIKTKGYSDEEISRMLGEAHANQKIGDMLNGALAAADAALTGHASLEHDYSGTGTLTHGQVNVGNAKMGDRSGQIVSYAVHSKVYHDVVGQAMTDKITDVANVAIRDGGTFFLGRSVLVTDDAALFDANGSLTDTYNTLGLVPGGVRITESEDEIVAVEIVTGLEQLVMRYQAEFAFNLTLKGFRWDVANGGSNPDDATLATQTNWDQHATSIKDCFGIRIITQ